MPAPVKKTVPTSPEAEELLAAGAAPVQPDVNTMMAQIERLQKQVDRMNQERGVPSDPVGFALQNLSDHAKTRDTMNTHVDFTELTELLTEARESKSPLDMDDATMIHDAVVALPNNAEGKDYLEQLARDLRKAIHKGTEESDA